MNVPFLFLPLLSYMKFKEWLSIDIQCGSRNMRQELRITVKTEDDVLDTENSVVIVGEGCRRWERI